MPRSETPPFTGFASEVEQLSANDVATFLGQGLGFLLVRGLVTPEAATDGIRQMAAEMSSPDVFYALLNGLREAAPPMVRAFTDGLVVVGEKIAAAKAEEKKS